MGRRFIVRATPVAALALVTCLGAQAMGPADAPLAIDTARVTIAGTSNIHEYTRRRPRFASRARGSAPPCGPNSGTTR